jgi:8-oxo-dGTP pyrophosphatase MutT (NUDIX family)
VIDGAILAAIEARLLRAGAVPEVGFRPFVAGGVSLGIIDDERVERLARFDCFEVSADAVCLDARLATPDTRTKAIAEVSATLRSEGALPAWRDEAYAVAGTFGETPLFLLERGAARYFGVVTYAAHVNGIVRASETTRMWLARRSHDKAVDPGLLDNLVGGGIAATLRVDETVVKEAWEEAGISAPLARCAQPAGIVCSRRPMFDGLQREILFVHDLMLPPEFVPRNQDGEAIEHRLVTLDEAARTIAADSGDDEVTVESSLAVLDYLVRQGEIRPDQPRYARLAGLLHRPL